MTENTPNQTPREAGQPSSAAPGSSLVTKFRSLPEAKAVPDEVWMCQQLLDRLAALDAERTELQDELFRWSPRMLAVLRRDWTDDELRAAGLMSEYRAPNAAIRGEEYEPDADMGRMEHDDCGDN